MINNKNLQHKVIEGDILVDSFENTKPNENEKFNVSLRSIINEFKNSYSTRWPNKLIPFEFDPAFRMLNT